MNKIDLIRLALKNFMRRKTRSILTILGVIIGTASIVVMLSLGIGMNESFKQNLKSMGSLNVIDVNPYYVPENTSGMVSVKESKLDDAAIAKIAAIDGVVAVTPYLNANLKIVSGKYSLQANIVGINPDAMEAFDFKVASGRLLTKEDTNVLLFGCQTPYSFMNPRANGNGGGMMYFGFSGNSSGEKKPDPLVDVLNDKMVMTFDWSYGERKSVGMTDPTVATKPPKLYKVQGVGILEESQDYDKAYTVYMNIEYLKKLTKEYNKSQSSGSSRGNKQQTDSYQQVKVKVENIDVVQKVQKQINDMGYGTNSLGDILKNMQKQSATMQAVLGGIGAISLFVAALGITNTMIMSIYERTREIGVMKVLGCLLGDIRNMFLFEAGVIGFTGGMAGLLFSYGASFVLNKFAGGLFGGSVAAGEANTISVIPVWLALSALGFATLVGLISGFMPARRAMKLSALEAIKSE